MVTTSDRHHAPSDSVPARDLREVTADDRENHLLREFGELRLRVARILHLWEFGLQRSVLTARERLALDVLALFSSHS